jgi:peptidoglycan/LPS O-acetylase OafA/YrhL
VAIALVIGCHYQAFATPLGGIGSFGWIGVDIFFVLSGFLITSILLRLKSNPDPYIPFLIRRMLRIMPPYLLVLLLFGGLGLLAATPAERLRSLPVLWNHFLFLSSMSQNTNYLAAATRTVFGSSLPTTLLSFQPPLAPAMKGFRLTSDFCVALAHFWSVSVEEWFYILWAPIVLLFRRRIVVVVACALVLLSFACRWFGFRDMDWYMNFVCRCDTLAVGGILALWIEFRSRLTSRRQRYCEWAIYAMAALALMTLCLLMSRIHPILGRELRSSAAFAAFGPPLIAVIVAGLIGKLVSGSDGNSPICKALRFNPLVYVGTRSYMLYLAHVPVYATMTMLIGSSASWLTSIGSLCLSLGVAAASWRFFEEPILFLRK